MCQEESKLVATSPISPDDIHLAQQQQQLHAKEPQAFVSTSPDNVPINEAATSPSAGDKLTTSASGKKINVTGGSVGNISTESLDGSYYGYYNNKNLLEADNIPVESRPKQTGYLRFNFSLTSLSFPTIRLADQLSEFLNFIPQKSFNRSFKWKL